MKPEEIIAQVGGQLVSGVVNSVFQTIRDSALSAEQQEVALNVLEGELSASVQRVKERKFRELPPVLVVPDPGPTAPGGG